MAEKDDNKVKKTLSLSKGSGVKKGGSADSMRLTVSRGRSKTVEVEVKRKRRVRSGDGDGGPEGGALTREELQKRLEAVRQARESTELSPRDEVAARLREEIKAKQLAEQKEREEIDAQRRQKAEQEEARREIEGQKRKEQADQKMAEARRAQGSSSAKGVGAREVVSSPSSAGEPAFEEPSRAEKKLSRSKEHIEERNAPKKSGGGSGRSDTSRRRSGKITVQQILSGGEERTRSLASVRRAREKERLQQIKAFEEQKPVVREVIVPEAMTVQELANRMAVRAAEIVKVLMKMGVMATINHNIDADTAELVVAEFGHTVKRVSEADVELGLKVEEEKEEDLKSRPPVVTIMGHVDHGKTSLLDAMRQTDVVAHEAGGITQHVGTYQVKSSAGPLITFVDTPGHAAFTEMRSRGADVTDIVILIVAADDGIKEQTIEAINHAKAAKVPMIVAINKIDRPEANPYKVKEDLLRYEVVTEEMGGDTLCVEISAKEHRNLDKLEEAILLQAELLDLKASSEGPAQGAVVEAKVERGRGPVATVLIQRGTVSVGDIFIAGAEWGKIKVLLDDAGKPLKNAGPSRPVHVVGANGAPGAGDDFVVVENEARAREVTEYRQRVIREKKAKLMAQTSMEQLFTKAIKEGERKELSVIIKGDVQGSVEAIVGSFAKLSNDEVHVQVLHTGVGEINESDVTLAQASDAMIIGFNVRANTQAREAARREQVPLRYYSIIYNVIDDVKAALEGMMAPELKEKFLGNAQVREVFNITKVGKIAGCMVTEGVVQRGAKVRLLRENVVIYEGSLKTLKRFKDEVKEVREGTECGMAFENYQDLRAGDVIECFDVQEIRRTLDTSV